MNQKKESLTFTIIFLLGIFLNIGLALNSGYFSHDEMGWGDKAMVGSLADLPFYSILGWDEFHYRPLNFNLWLVLSYYFFDLPQVFHLVILMLGTLNSYLFYLIVRNETTVKLALPVVLFSFIAPSIVFVNGWIGTIADIMWFQFCCISFLLFQLCRRSNSTVLLFFSLLFFILSLMFKETAVTFPGVIFIYVFYKTFGASFSLPKKIKNIDIIFFSFTALIVLCYLILRFEFLFPSNGGGYGNSIQNIPIRMLEYFIYPFLVSNIEIHGLFTQHSSLELFAAAGLHIFIIILFAKKNIISYCYYLAGYFVCISPMLILDMSLPHYMYGAGFFMSFILGLVYYNMNIGKVFIISLAILLFFHSFNIQKNYLITGYYQSNFLTSLYTTMKNDLSEGVVAEYHIIPEQGSISWVAVRAIAFKQKLNDVTIANKVTIHSHDASIPSEGDKITLKLLKSGIVHRSSK